MVAAVAMAAARVGPHAYQVAWLIVQKATARALDYDMCVCPFEALFVAQGVLCNAVSRSVSAIAGGGPLPGAALVRVGLPGPLGGCSLRPVDACSAGAAFWSSWVAVKDDVPRVATQLGRGAVLDPDDTHEAAAA